MAYMTRIDRFVTAHPGTPESIRPVMDGDGRTLLTLRPGETFTGGRRSGIPLAADQRRAMLLADATGDAVGIVDGHYMPAFASAPTWDVKRAGAPGESHRTGWLVTMNGATSHAARFADVVSTVAWDMPRVTTNGQRRELLTLVELSDAEREEFDYVTEDDAYDARFVRAYGNVYDVNDSQRITVSPRHESFGGFNVSPHSPLASWHGISTESHWSGTTFRLLSGDDEGFVVVGHFYSA